MKARMLHGWGWALLLFSGAVVLAGCGNERAAAPQLPVAIQKGDISEGCGMAIEGSPGPRAEAYVDQQGEPLKFGSVRDFFAYILQPENRQRVRGLYVQDVAGMDWAHPPGTADSFVDARNASYVAWQPWNGMMGSTFASFASRTAAEDFVRRHGGKVLRFDQVTVALVAGLDSTCPAPGSPLHELAAGCESGPNS